MVLERLSISLFSFVFLTRLMEIKSSIGQLASPLHTSSLLRVSVASIFVWIDMISFSVLCSLLPAHFAMHFHQKATIGSFTVFGIFSLQWVLHSWLKQLILAR